MIITKENINQFETKDLAQIQARLEEEGEFRFHQAEEFQKKQAKSGISEDELAWSDKAILRCDEITRMLTLLEEVA